jgi:double-stranded RNA-specific adenosine deaminase
MRSAEKKRESSCSWADRVSTITLDAYQQQCPEQLLRSYERQQTVLSSILVHNSIDDVLQVVSLGVGTKILSMGLIRDDEIYKKRVRDMHAEVLARRGALLYIYDQITRASEEGCVEGSIFVARHDNTFSLRPSITFHLYTSSTPCGNSTIKRWAKGRKPTKYTEQGNAFPASVEHRHPRFFVTAREQGQVALLVKRDGKVKVEKVETKGVKQEKEKERGEENEEEECDAGFVYPVGTLPLHLSSGCGCILSCSDKIAKWNCLGLQGCLLAQFVNSPIYLETITIGRKFGQPFAERALCCRVSGFSYSPPASCPSSTPLYTTKHPAILCTSVKFDEGCFAVEEQGKSGAIFNESRCFAWWISNSSTSGATMTVLDSFTGMEREEEKKERESPIASASLYREYLRLHKKLGGDVAHTPSLIEIKNDDTRHYVAARNLLFSTPSLFKGWIRGLG